MATRETMEGAAAAATATARPARKARTAHKRGQNEGSIFRRADGRWAAQLNLGYEAGKRKRKYFYGETRREVQEQLTAALRNRQQGLPVAASLRPKTYDSYALYVRRHIIPELGREPLARLDPQRVQTFLNRKATSRRARARRG